MNLRPGGPSHRLIDRIFEAILSGILALIVVIAFLEVVFRYVIGSSLVWSFEALLILLTYITFLGAYMALRRGEHLRIVVLVMKLPRIGQTILFVFNQVGIGVTVWVMAIWGFDYAFRFPDQTTIFLKLPVSALYIVIPVSGFAMGLQVFWDLARGLKRVHAGLPPEDLQVKEGI